MSPIKRSVINTIVYMIAYIGVNFVMKRDIDIMMILILAIVCFLLNYIIYSILEKVSDD